MLVLSRRVGESVVIGDDIVVTVLDVRGDIVRLGVDAPRSVNVHRAEVLRELEKVNKESAAPSAAAMKAMQDAVRRKQERSQD